MKPGLSCRKLVDTVLGAYHGPFSPSRHLTILGGALIRNIVFQVLATGTLGHPWPADVTLAGNPARFHQGSKALVRHDDRMAEDVSRNPLISPLIHTVFSDLGFYRHFHQYAAPLFSPFDKRILRSSGQEQNFVALGQRALYHSQHSQP